MEDVTKSLQDTQATLERVQEELSECNHQVASLFSITLKILHSSIGTAFKNGFVAFVWRHLKLKCNEEN